MTEPDEGAEGVRRSLLSGTGALLLTAGVGIASVAAPASAAPNPPGNNGTVKIDGVAFDDHPNNEPHVGCTFQVDFYGYDEGDLDAEVVFEAWPPTLREAGDQTLLTDSVFIGEDDNAGGGSEAGLDASVTYTLDVSGITPHPQQGVHVKLTVHAEGSQGADVKHKVFWVEGCAPTPTPTTPEPTPTDTVTPTPTPTKSHTKSPTKSPTGSPTGSPTESPTQTASPTPTSSPSPGSTAAPTVPTKPAAGRLPVTGGGLVAGLIGLALLGGGAMLIIVGRRRTT